MPLEWLFRSLPSFLLKILSYEAKPLPISLGNCLRSMRADPAWALVQTQTSGRLATWLVLAPSKSHLSAGY
jgi:hypothetical protein